MRNHGAAVVVNVVAALAVGKDLNLLNKTGGIRSGRRQRVGGVRVSDSKLGVDEHRPPKYPRLLSLLCGHSRRLLYDLCCPRSGGGGCGPTHLGGRVGCVLGEAESGRPAPPQALLLLRRGPLLPAPSAALRVTRAGPVRCSSARRPWSSARCPRLGASGPSSRP